MSSFKTYKEAIEFHRNNHPVQTRMVLIEKYSSKIEQKKFLEILYKPAPAPEEIAKIVEERKARIAKMLLKSSFEYSYNGPSYEFMMEECGKNKPNKNDDIGSMWLDICELF